MSTPLNRFSNLMALAIPAAGMLTCGSAQAASDIYIKFDGVDGESAAVGYEKHLEVLSWSWGATNSSSIIGGGGGGAGKVSMQDFHFTCKVNSASPALMLACATGQHIPTATFRFVRTSSSGKPEEYYVVTLSDVMVSSFSSSRPAPTSTTTAPDPAPVEKVTLNFTKIEFKYTPAAAAGSTATPVTATVDVAR
jgi:type VI secretion system secreted protein Hcp